VSCCGALIRVLDLQVGLAPDTTFSVNIGSGVLLNYAVTGAETIAAPCTYTTLYEDLVQPELLSVSGLTGPREGAPYSFSNYGTSASSTTFTLSFSEKVVGVGSAALYTASATTTFTLSGEVETDGRTVTLETGVLAAGEYTLSVPYASLTDLATETGVAANPFKVSSDCSACGSDSTDAAFVSKITVSGLGETAPGFTEASSGVVQTDDPDTTSLQVKEGTISRTLILQFAEAVTITDTSKTMTFYSKNRTNARAQQVLTVALDGTVTCVESVRATGCTGGTLTGALEFNWMSGCTSIAGACKAEYDKTKAGGAHYLFVFLNEFLVTSDASEYYFLLDDEFALVNAYDYPMIGTTTKLGHFTVYNPHAVVRTEVTLDVSGLADRTAYAVVRGSTDNILLTFNERVDFDDAATTIATITSRI